MLRPMQQLRPVQRDTIKTDSLKTNHDESK